jgi:hypothetical protein
MKTLLDNLARLMPPLWLLMALAAALGAAMLAAFIEILQQNVRHGEEMRRWQRVGVVRQPIGTVTTSAAPMQPRQFTASISPQLQR